MQQLVSTDHTIFERFLQPSERAAATIELVTQGAAALPILQSLLSGEATNSWGVPYRKLGVPVDCALVAIQRLGPIALPLEAYVKHEIENGHSYAADALTAIHAL